MRERTHGRGVFHESARVLLVWGAGASHAGLERRQRASGSGSGSASGGASRVVVWSRAATGVLLVEVPQRCRGRGAVHDGPSLLWPRHAAAQEAEQRPRLPQRGLSICERGDRRRRLPIDQPMDQPPCGRLAC